MSKETTASVRYDLDGQASCVAEARRQVEAFLAAVDPRADPNQISLAVLITSELVSNAVQHAPGPSTLWLSADRAHFRIAVTDSSVRPPVEREAGVVGDGHGGAGLRLVRAIAGAVEVHIHPAGKTVSVTLGRGSPSQTFPPRPRQARDPS